MNLRMGVVLVYLLFAISIASFAYGVYMGFEGDYQESIFLSGIGFVVLAQAVFVYRALRYPDARKD